MLLQTVYATTPKKVKRNSSVQTVSSHKASPKKKRLCSMHPDSQAKTHYPLPFPPSVYPILRTMSTTSDHVLGKAEKTRPVLRTTNGFCEPEAPKRNRFAAVCGRKKGQKRTPNPKRLGSSVTLVKAAGIEPASENPFSQRSPSAVNSFHSPQRA